MIHVRTKFERPAADLVEQLGQYSSATIHEAQGRLGAFDSSIKPIDRSMSFCGPAVTVGCAPKDNLMLQVGIHYAQAGDVLVVSAGEYTEAGTFGDVLGTAMHSKGLAALVTDSGVRDTADLIELGLPVFSRSVCIKGTVKETLGPINHPLVFAGQLVEPGDLDPNQVHTPGVFVQRVVPLTAEQVAQKRIEKRTTRPAEQEGAA